MKHDRLEGRQILWLILAAALVLLAAVLPAANPGKYGPDIYDPGADVKGQLAAVVKTAGPENRNILLMFGGNGCPRCHRLHELFAADAAAQPRPGRPLADQGFRLPGPGPRFHAPAAE